MKIPCDKCGAVFEAADDQELCAACRDAVAIGDPYRATPAVMGEDAPPAKKDGVTIAGLAPPLAVDHAALFHAAVRVCRQRPTLLLAHGVVSYVAMVPFFDVLLVFQNAAGASRADLSLTALVALMTLGLACAAQTISFAVTVVRLERWVRDGGARRPIWLTSDSSFPAGAESSRLAACTASPATRWCFAFSFPVGS